MDDPKAKYEAALKRARELGEYMADEGAHVVVHTETLQPDDTIQVLNDQTTLGTWLELEPRPQMLIRLNLRTNVCTLRVAAWDHLPEVTKQIAAHVRTAETCLNEPSMRALYDDARVALVDIEAAYEPMYKVYMQEETNDVHPRIAEAVRKYLKHKQFLEENGVIKRAASDKTRGAVPDGASSERCVDAERLAWQVASQYHAPSGPTGMMPAVMHRGWNDSLVGPHRTSHN